MMKKTIFKQIGGISRVLYIICVMLMIHGNEAVAKDEPSVTEGKENGAPASSDGEMKSDKKKGPAMRSKPSLRRSKGKKSELSGYYIGGFGGIDGIFTDSEPSMSTVFGTTSNQFDLERDTEVSETFGAKFGFMVLDGEKSWDEFQVVPAFELEASYMRIKDNPSGLAPSMPTTQGSGVGTNINLELELITVTANALVKFRTPYVTPYAGFGGGIGHIRVDRVSGSVVSTAAGPGATSSGGIFQVDKNSQFIPVLQGIGGFETDIFSPRFTFFTEYKVVYVPDISFDFDLNSANSGNTADIDYDFFVNHILQAGVKYNF